MNQGELPFGRYPHRPGFRHQDTSRIAAEQITVFAGTVRGEVLRFIARQPDGATPDEAAAALGLTPFTVRPRCTELYKLGFLYDSGLRRRNGSGKLAIVWMATDTQPSC